MESACTSSTYYYYQVVQYGSGKFSWETRGPEIAEMRKAGIIRNERAKNEKANAGPQRKGLLTAFFESSTLAWLSVKLPHRYSRKKVGLYGVK